MAGKESEEEKKKRESITKSNRRQSVQAQKKIKGKLNLSQIVAVPHKEAEPPIASESSYPAVSPSTVDPLEDKLTTPKPKKAKRKVKYPFDPVRHNPEVAVQKRIRLAMFRCMVECSLMERERFDYLTAMNLRSQTDKGPKWDKDDLQSFLVMKLRTRGILEPRCLAHEDITKKEYEGLKTNASQTPHIRYLVCPCTAIMDVIENPLPPLYPKLRTPTFQ